MIDQFNEKLVTIIPPLVLALLAAGVRFVLTPRKTVGTFLRGLFVAGTAGYIANLAMIDLEVSEGIRAALVGMVAFVADDILTGILTEGQKFRKDPIGWMLRASSASRQATGAEPETQAQSEKTGKGSE